MWAVIRIFLERLSFLLWIAFTIFAISLTGLGLEGMVFAAFVLVVSGTHPIPLPLEMVTGGGVGVFLSIFWRQVGIDHFHYLDYDSVVAYAEDMEAPSRVLHDLIDEVESSEGFARNDARVKAKEWLLSHASALDPEDILLARAHFGYLLPNGWGDER